MSVPRPGHDLKASLDGASAIIHLDGGVDETRTLLEAAGGIGATTIVLLSSATVYGAWPTNPVPLTEDAPLRPNTDLEFAVRAAERERLAVEWKSDHPGRHGRHPPTRDPGGRGRTRLARSRATHRSRGATGQFRRPAGAVRASRRRRERGGAGVAQPPRRSVQRGTRRMDPGRSGARPGRRPSVRVPDPVAQRLAWARWKLGLSSTPPGILPYTVHPWVIANDRMKAAGWSPTSTNEEAYVAGHRAAPWATVSPQRRQELALGAAAAALSAAVAGRNRIVRRTRRRRP